MPNGKYSIVLADPPWRFRNWSMKSQAQKGENWGRANGRASYPVMNTADIAAMPVADLAAKDCALFLWATHPKLPDALEVIKGWGFEHKTTAWTWIKTGKNNGAILMGLGYGTRKNTEILLYASRGKTHKRLNNRLGEVVFWPRMEHSRKPDCFHKLIVELYGDLPRVELFARRTAPGWAAWGNQVESSPEAIAVLGQPGAFTISV